MMTKEDLNIPLEEYEFYQRCADILEIEHVFSKKWERRNRWNHRQLGNGRFIGYGTIRWFSNSLIHLSFTKPTLVSKTFSKKEDVYIFLHLCKKY